MIRRVALLAAVAVLAVAFPSCPDEDTSVTVSWRFGAAQLGCEAAGVQTVHVFIGPLAPTGSYDHEVECAAGENGLEMTGVAAGRHVLVIKGLARDHVLFFVQREIEVSEGGDLGTIAVPAYTPP